ncbi:MAG: TraB/GumN family protein [Proteobacteria bacterium]|nr:TraB/GumN family protein [Pseudomonadota bacterium]
MYRRKIAWLLFGWLALILVAAGNVAAGSPKTFLWEVGTGTGRAYVLGSIHLAKPDIYPLDSRIESAFQRADGLAVEADVRSLDPARIGRALRDYGLYPEGQTLEGSLPSPIKAMMQARGLDMARLNPLRPWLAAATIQAEEIARLGLSEEYGIDLYFLQKAAASGKPVRELESVDYQFELLGSLSPGEQVLFLKATLLELDDMADGIESLMDAWRNGDAKRFEERFFEKYAKQVEFHPLMEKLIFQRNDLMCARIEELARSGRTWFVVVGAGHLVGERGLIRMLQSKGYTVDQR